MRSTRWLIVLSVLATSCRGNERPELPFELEWRRSVGSPVLVQGAGGFVVVGEEGARWFSGTRFRLYAPDDRFLVAPLYEVSLDNATGEGIALSATRAIFSQPDPARQSPTTALVVDLTSGVPPITWSVQLSPGSVPLLADGHWILSCYGDYRDVFLELIDLDEPSSRFTHWMPGFPTLAIAAQGHMRVFRWGESVRVSPELAAAGQGFEEEEETFELYGVFEAIVEGDEVLLANFVYGPPRIRIARHELVDGRPQWPPSKAVELELPLESWEQLARFAWDGRGTGVLARMELPNDCLYVNNCRTIGTPAYLVEERDDGFHARPVLLPYLELDESHQLGWVKPRTMAARDGRLLTFQGPPYELAWYRIDGGAP